MLVLVPVLVPVLVLRLALVLALPRLHPSLCCNARWMFNDLARLAVVRGTRIPYLLVSPEGSGHGGV